jgi:hypothetical protein
VPTLGITAALEPASGSRKRFGSVYYDPGRSVNTILHGTQIYTNGVHVNVRANVAFLRPSSSRTAGENVVN